MLIVRGHNLYPQDQNAPSRARCRRRARAGSRPSRSRSMARRHRHRRRDRSRRPEIGAGPGADHRLDPPGGGRGLPGSAEVVALLNPGALAEDVQRQAATFRLPPAPGRRQPGQLCAVSRPPGRAGRRSRRQGDDELLARIGRDLEGPAGRGAGSAARSLLPAWRQFHRRCPGGRPGARQSRRRPRPAPTVRGADPQAFSATVARQLAAGLPAEAPMAHLPRGVDSPQSAAQQRLWLTWQIDPQSAAYNTSALRLRGELDKRAARQLPAPGRTPPCARVSRARRRGLQRIDRAGRVRLAVRRPAALAEHERAAAAQRREAERAAAVRPGKGAAVRSAWCAWTNRSTSLGHPASHRRRWLVAEPAARRILAALRRSLRRPAGRPGAAGTALRRVRRLATAVAGRGRGRPPTGLLAGCLGDAAPVLNWPPTIRARRARRRLPRATACGSTKPWRGLSARPRWTMRRVSSCGCWRRSRRCCIATAGRARSASACLAQPPAPGDPGAGRLLHQHPGPARHARRASRSPRCSARLAGDPRRPGQPGPAVRPGARGLRQGGSCSRCCSTTSSATCRRCAGCPACSPTSCPGTAAKLFDLQPQSEE